MGNGKLFFNIISVVDRKKKKLSKVRPNTSLDSITKMLKLRYFGFLMRDKYLEKDIMLAITAGARKNGKPRVPWIEDVKSVTGLSVNYLR